MRTCIHRVPRNARHPTNRSSTRIRSSSTEEKVAPASHAVLLQGFHWESCDAQSQGKSWYEIVKENVDLIAESGMSDVWLPPPSQSVAPQGYLPSKLYALDSEYGTQKELQDLIQALHARGVRAICDVVINHRCADKQDAEGKWTVFTDPDWEAWAIVGDDKTQWYWGSGGADTGADYAAAPDIDHTNAEVRESIKKWLNWLKDEVGFDGWRFDFVRGFAPHFVKEYVESSLGGSMDEHVVVGEFWDSGGPWQLHDFVNSTGMACGAFDFPLKGELQNAMGNYEYWRLGKSFDGRSPGLMGVLPERAFTFVENHDTGSPQYHWPHPQGKEMEGYAYILTHPGTPCVFWKHLFDPNLKEGIANISRARKAAGVHRTSRVDVAIAENDCYVAYIEDGKLAVKIGPRFDLGASCPDPKMYDLVASGSDFAVWLKKGT